MTDASCARITVEHKSDRIASRTGNIFVEYRQKGRKSGLATTKADFYAIEIYPDKWIVMRTEELKSICRKIIESDGERTKRGFPERVKMGGNFKQYQGVLVKLTELL